MQKVAFCLWLGLSCYFVQAKNPDSLFLELVGEFEYSFTYSAYTTLLDKQGRPYIYAASSELGLVIFDYSDPSHPFPTDTLARPLFNNRNVTNIFISGNWLYASLGGFQGIPQLAGMAIVNISDPEEPQITDVWDSTAFDQGCAIVIVEGDYAYLGAMERGLLTLDVSAKNNIRFVSQFVPDPNFPVVPGLFTQPNARGLAIRNDTIFLCNDSKGFRMIDVSDKLNPVEVGKYVNPVMDSVAGIAYNNVVLVDHYAYCAVDYCGVDVVDIRDTNMESVHWFNPWDCNKTNWNKRAGHTNQLVALGDSLLIVSGADSEVLVFDIKDRANPVLRGSYANVGDSIVAWGVDAKEDTIVLALVDNPFGTPYISNYGGIQILKIRSSTTNISKPQTESADFSVMPNPSSKVLRITSNGSSEWGCVNYRLAFIDARIAMEDFICDQHSFDVDVSTLATGIYFLQLFVKPGFFKNFKIMIN